MNRKEPVYSVTAHWSTQLPGYIGLGLTLLLAVVAWVFSAAFGLLIAAVAILGFSMLEIVRRAERLALYDDGIAKEFKLLSTRRTFAEYESVQDLELTQTFFERLLGVGTLHVNTSGSHGQEIVFRGIDRPHDVEHAIRAKMQAASVDTSAN